jgi:RNA polymerase sigma-70 factor (ECF subfamily)
MSHTALSAHEEAQLIPSLLVDDEDAWRTFHARYGNRMQGAIAQVIRRFPRLGGTDHQEEIYATLCLRLLSDDKRRLRSFDPTRGTPFGAWLCTLAKNCAHDFLRGRRRQPWLARAGEDISEREPECDQPDALRVCCAREEVRVLERLAQDLTARDREFLEAYLGGAEPEQIALELGISVSTVYSKKHKVLARLTSLAHG